ncbi:hypothetical protein RJ639_015401 [Escallonia herrerae]|uniref:Reverse transcriptase Ty1/copia-type domain-containing protein n=1 Tax=Escallonia herrerae TaxID=1293975 RepID=A0AA89AN34_9ASTE|nr:hypothetical protein RJ639_015401 [Escallonia herrerae]
MIDAHANPDMPLVQIPNGNTISVHALGRANLGQNLHLEQVLGVPNSQSDHSLFTFTHQGSFLVVLIYVDDVIVTATDSTKISWLKYYLDSKFHIKDLGNLKYFLGIEVARSSDGIVLRQRKYFARNAGKNLKIKLVWGDEKLKTLVEGTTAVRGSVIHRIHRLSLTSPPRIELERIILTVGVPGVWQKANLSCSRKWDGCGVFLFPLS